MTRGGIREISEYFHLVKITRYMLSASYHDITLLLLVMIIVSSIERKISTLP